MTNTPLDYFDKVPGTLEQLVLGVITQKLINRDYIHESLATDFTTNAISYSVTADSGDNLAINSNLSLSLTFPTIPFERQILVDKDSYDLRILSLNSLNIDTLSLPQKPFYPAKSIAPQLPGYLLLPVPENILERRLLALCLNIRNYINWIDRWNNVAAYWIFTVVSNQPFISYPLAEIEADRNDLLLELANGITYKAIPAERYYTSEPIIADNPSTAQELIDNFGASDPANDNQSPLSSSLLSELSSSGGGGDNESSSNQPDRPTPNEPEKPTLPDC